MLLYFSDVVRHVIDHMHIQIIRSGIENFGKSLTEKKKTCEEVVGTGTSKMGEQSYFRKQILFLCGCCLRFLQVPLPHEECFNTLS